MDRCRCDSSVHFLLFTLPFLPFRVNRVFLFLYDFFHSGRLFPSPSRSLTQTERKPFLTFPPPGLTLHFSVFLHFFRFLAQIFQLAFNDLQFSLVDPGFLLYYQSKQFTYSHTALPMAEIPTEPPFDRDFSLDG